MNLDRFLFFLSNDLEGHFKKITHLRFVIYFDESKAYVLLSLILLIYINYFNIRLISFKPFNR